MKKGLALLLVLSIWAMVGPAFAGPENQSMILIVPSRDAQKHLIDTAISERGLNRTEIVKAIFEVPSRGTEMTVPVGTVVISPKLVNGRGVLEKSTLSAPERAKVRWLKNGLGVLYSQSAQPWGFIVMSPGADAPPVVQQAGYQPSVAPPVYGASSRNNVGDVVADGGQPQVLVAKADDAELMTRPSETAAHEATQKANEAKQAAEQYEKQRDIKRNTTILGGVTILGGYFGHPLVYVLGGLATLIYNFAASD